MIGQPLEVDLFEQMQVIADSHGYVVRSPTPGLLKPLELLSAALHRVPLADV